MPQKPKIPKEQLLHLPVAVATGLYSGLLPVAPGTWGSAAALVLFVPLSFVPLWWYLAAVVALFFIGVWAAGATEKIVDRKDPGQVVIDEIVGMLITLAASPLHPLPLFAGFLLFRFFDIVKPFPVRWAEEKFAGGLGVMADDVVAGLYALACLTLFSLWW